MAAAVLATAHETTPAWHAVPGGVRLRVKADPKSRRPGITGLAPDIDGPRLRVAVTQAPEDGRATDAVCATIARALGLKTAAVSLLQGATSRQKLLLITGDPPTIIAALENLGAIF